MNTDELPKIFTFGKFGLNTIDTLTVAEFDFFKKFCNVSVIL
jgi:hypothetical protein